MHSCLLDVSVIHTRDYLRIMIHGRIGHSCLRSVTSQQIGSGWGGRGGHANKLRSFDYC